MTWKLASYCLTVTSTHDLIGCRKALIWQKKYLLVLLGGEAQSTDVQNRFSVALAQEPVFPVTRDYSLAPLARFR